MPDALAVSDSLSDSYAPTLAPYPPDKPPQPANPMQDRLDSILSKEDAEIERLKSSTDRESVIADEKVVALAPIRQRMAEMARQPALEVPQLQEPPKPPQRSQIDQKNAEDWTFAAGLLGALAGSFTRRHATNALGAFQGAMEGYAAGNKQAFDQNMKTWEAENKRVVEHNNLVLSRYREVMENRKHSMEQMSVELQMAAAEFDDKAMATAAKSKNFQVIAQLYDKQAQSVNQMSNSQERLSLQFEQMKQKERLEMLKAQMRATGFGTDPGQMQNLIDGIGQGRMAPIRGRAGTQIMAEVARQYPDYSEGKYKENMFRDTMKAHQEMAGNNAYERTAGLQGANIEMISRTVRALIPQALESSRQVDRANFRQLNELVQLFEKNALSDPILKRFAFDTIQVAEGWARSMNPRGQMRVDDRRIALEHIATVDGPEAYEAVLKGIDESLWRETIAIQEQRAHAPVPPPIDFGKTGTPGRPQQQTSPEADPLGIR